MSLTLSHALETQKLQEQKKYIKKICLTHNFARFTGTLNYQDFAQCFKTHFFFKLKFKNIKFSYRILVLTKRKGGKLVLTKSNN